MSGLSEVLKHLGDKMVLKNREGQRPIRAFIQPVPTREEVIPGEKTAIGWVDHCLWSYTGMEEAVLFHEIAAAVDDQRQQRK